MSSAALSAPEAGGESVGKDPLKLKFAKLLIIWSDRQLTFATHLTSINRCVTWFYPPGIDWVVKIVFLNVSKYIHL